MHFKHGHQNKSSRVFVVLGRVKLKNKIKLLSLLSKRSHFVAEDRLI